MKTTFVGSGPYEEAWREAMRHHAAGVVDCLLVEYRCRTKGCLLLRVWQAPRGIEFYAPSVRVSNQKVMAKQWHWLGFNRANERQTGDRAGRLDDLAKLQYGGFLWLLCHHVTQAEWVADIRRDCSGRAPGDAANIFLPDPAREVSNPVPGITLRFP